jgi:F-type H+-transporting ATPase subunit epsilon
MEASLILEVRTPDKEIFSGEIEQVILPGKDGSFGILKNHAPLIASLQKGKVSIDALSVTSISLPDNGELDIEEQKHFDFTIEGGVVEVLNNRVTVLVA